MSSNVNIDVERFDRQIFTIGEEAMKSIVQSNVLIIGAGGVGIEIAKNVVLCGVNSLCLHDQEKAAMKDLASQFYLTENSIGKNRASESIEKLSNLNPRVKIYSSDQELKDINEIEKIVEKFNCVILTIPIKYSQIFAISSICRRKSIAFIIAMSRGVFGLIFDDLGPNFIVKEPNMTDPMPSLITSIKYNPDEHICIVNYLSENNLYIPSGSIVKFSKIKGMDGLEGQEFKVKYIDYNKFSIEHTPEGQPLPPDQVSGYFVQVFKPVTLHFREITEALNNPVIPEEINNFHEGIRGRQTIISFFSLFKSIEENDTSFENVLKNAHKINEEFQILKNEEKIDEAFIREFVREDVVISPSASIIGGIAGQEVIKSVTGKFLPLQEFFTLSDLEALQPKHDSTFHVTVKNDRYDGYRLVFGDEQFEKMTKLKYLMVGAGAIGCELLKNCALMGVATDAEGQIYLTDDDKIELSNLNRQFLFKEEDRGKYKSECAAESVRNINPSIKIQCYTKRINVNSDFDTEFYQKLDGICNAVDNVAARKYNDTNAVFYDKPLIDSGTTGPRGYSHSYVPYLTDSYQSSSHSEDVEDIPVCTLRDFPINIIHCSVWAKDQFLETFYTSPIEINEYITHTDYIKERAKIPALLAKNMMRIGNLINRPDSYVGCAQMARKYFDKLFIKKIQDLFIAFPRDLLKEDGTKHWSGIHREPKVIQYDPTNKLHAEFIITASILFSKVYNIQIPEDQIENLPQIALDENNDYKFVDIEDYNKDRKKYKGNNLYTHINHQIYKVTNKYQKIKDKEKYLTIPQEFEKDDPTNGQIDFISAAANLRAEVYNIQTETKLNIKKIVGRIQPAISTTTAAVCGYVSLELFKIHSVTAKTTDDFKAAYINLANNAYNIFSPADPSVKKAVIKSSQGTRVISSTLWDKWIFEGDLTFGELCDQIEKKSGLHVFLLVIGENSFIMSGLSEEETENTKMKKISELFVSIPEKMFPIAVFMQDDEGNQMFDDKGSFLPQVYLKIK